MSDYSSALPAPFIIGFPRSGTTLLRLMLDAHPELAIPPETHLCQVFGKPYATGVLTPEIRIDLLGTLVSSARWADLHIERHSLESAIEGIPDGQPVGEAIACLWNTYAAKFGKTRWGDKSPSHMMCVTAIAHALPQARFIHIVRDPRDVVCSMREVWFAQGRTVSAIAQDWVNRLTMFQVDALQFPARLMVLRYEDLVTQPAEWVRQICNFINLSFDAKQLDFFERAPERMSELSELRTAAGTTSAAARRSIHALTARETTGERIGRWRKDLSSDDVKAIEEIVSPTARVFRYV